MTDQNIILVISDHPGQFSDAASRLRNDGYRVRFETNSEASLRFARTEYPRLIISELAVPNIDGLKLCVNIRNTETLGSTPILLVGDLSEESEIVSDGLRCGATDYLQKPLDHVRLFEVCRELANLPDPSDLITLRTASMNIVSLASAMANALLREAIFDRSPVALARFSTSGHFIEGNPALLAKLSNSYSELQNMSLSELIFPLNDDIDRQAIGEILSGTRTSYEFENGYLSPTGERVWGRVALVMCSGHGSGFFIGVFNEPEGVECHFEFNECDRHLPPPPAVSTVLNLRDWKINRSLVSDN